MKNNIKVLIEASKALSLNQDGTTRYVRELLYAIQEIIDRENTNLRIDIFWDQGMYFKIMELGDFNKTLEELHTSTATNKSENTLSKIKGSVKKSIKDYCSNNTISIIRKIKRAVYHKVLYYIPTLKFNQYDVVHLTQPQSYLFFRNCSTRMVTTIHDLTHLLFPQFHLEENITNAQCGVQLAIEKESEFIAVSTATQQDILSLLPMISPEHIHVIHEACDTQIFMPCVDPNIISQVKTKYGIPEGKYLLSLSTLEPRKNLLNSIKAFLLMIEEQPESEINFVIAGRSGWMQDELLNMTQNHKDRLIFTGFVDDTDLPPLYSAATAFSYVSFYEGFGLPPLEAMSCGVPVIYGNNSSMIEVVGNGGLPADPSDIEDIKEKYQIMAWNNEIRDNTAKIAQERARNFSWETTARETVALYKKIAGNGLNTT